INRVLPPPEGVAQQLASLLGPTELPKLFAGVQPSPAPPLDLPGSGTVRALAQSAAASTVQVVTIRCAREQLGTGLYVAVHAVVPAEFTALGPDIYDHGRVSGAIVGVRADVRRGGSGGRLLTAPGLVGGIVFGASRTSPGVGYAISANSVAAEIREASTRTGAVPSGACTAE